MFQTTNQFNMVLQYTTLTSGLSWAGLSVRRAWVKRPRCMLNSIKLRSIKLIKIYQNHLIPEIQLTQQDTRHSLVETGEFILREVPIIKIARRLHMYVVWKHILWLAFAHVEHYCMEVSWVMGLLPVISSMSCSECPFQTNHMDSMDPCGDLRTWGFPNSWMVCSGKYQSKMDDLVVPLWKPPYINIYSAFFLTFCFIVL